MNVSYALAQLTFGTLFKLLFRWRVYHRDRIPAEGPVLLASNHASFMDPPAIGAGARRLINFLARDSLFTNLITGPLFRSWQAIPVDREGGGASGINAVLDRLASGNMVLLFCEGTRTRDGCLQPARAGIGLIAIRSGAPVVPVRIFGTFEAWGRHMKLPRFHPISVKFGHPIRFDGLQAEAKVCPKPRLKQIYQEVADQIMAEIAKIEPGPDREPKTAT